MLAPTDFAEFSAATGTEYPSSPEEKARIAPIVAKFKAEQEAQQREGRGPNVLGGLLVGSGMLGAGIGAAALAQHLKRQGVRPEVADQVAGDSPASASAMERAQQLLGSVGSSERPDGLIVVTNKGFSTDQARGLYNPANVANSGEWGAKIRQADTPEKQLTVVAEALGEGESFARKVAGSIQALNSRRPEGQDSYLDPEIAALHGGRPARKGAASRSPRQRYGGVTAEEAYAGGESIRSGRKEPGFRKSSYVPEGQSRGQLILLNGATTRQGKRIGYKVENGKSVPATEKPIFLRDENGKLLAFGDWKASKAYQELTGAPIPVTSLVEPDESFGLSHDELPRLTQGLVERRLQNEENAGTTYRTDLGEEIQRSEAGAEHIKSETSSSLPRAIADFKAQRDSILGNGTMRVGRQHLPLKTGNSFGVEHAVALAATLAKEHNVDMRDVLRGAGYIQSTREELSDIGEKSNPPSVFENSLARQNALDKRRELMAESARQKKETGRGSVVRVLSGNNDDWLTKLSKVMSFHDPETYYGEQALATTRASRGSDEWKAAKRDLGVSYLAAVPSLAGEVRQAAGSIDDSELTSLTGEALMMAARDFDAAIERFPEAGKLAYSGDSGSISFGHFAKDYVRKAVLMLSLEQQSGEGRSTPVIRVPVGAAEELAESAIKSAKPLSSVIQDLVAGSESPVMAAVRLDGLTSDTVKTLDYGDPSATGSYLARQLFYGDLSLAEGTEIGELRKRLKERSFGSRGRREVSRYPVQIQLSSPAPEEGAFLNQQSELAKEEFRDRFLGNSGVSISQPAAKAEKEATGINRFRKEESMGFKPSSRLKALYDATQSKIGVINRMPDLTKAQREALREEAIQQGKEAVAKQLAIDESRDAILKEIADFNTVAMSGEIQERRPVLADYNPREGKRDIYKTEETTGKIQYQTVPVKRQIGGGFFLVDDGSGVRVQPFSHKSKAAVEEADKTAAALSPVLSSEKVNYDSSGLEPVTSTLLGTPEALQTAAEYDRDAGGGIAPAELDEARRRLRNAGYVPGTPEFQEKQDARGYLARAIANPARAGGWTGRTGEELVAQSLSVPGGRSGAMVPTTREEELYSGRSGAGDPEMRPKPPGMRPRPPGTIDRVIKTGRGDQMIVPVPSGVPAPPPDPVAPQLQQGSRRLGGLLGNPTAAAQAEIPQEALDRARVGYLADYMDSMWKAGMVEKHGKLVPKRRGLNLPQWQDPSDVTLQARARKLLGV